MSDTFLPGSGFDTYEQQDKVLVGLGGGTAAKVAVRILQQQGFAVAGCRREALCRRRASGAVRKRGRKGPWHRVCHPQRRGAGYTGSHPCGRPPLCPADGGRQTGHPVHRHRHFAQVETGADGISHIYPPEDPAQDESDALAALPQDILARLILPLGSFTPEDVQEMAADFNV